MSNAPSLRVGHILMGSYAHGAGKRNVIFVRGCSIKCPGCANKHLWDSGPHLGLNLRQLAKRMVSNNPDGITISGGEPTEQLDAVLLLCDYVHKLAPGMHIIMYSGLPRVGVRKMWDQLLNRVDVVLAGPYIAKKHINESDRGALLIPVGSSNQEVLHVTASMHEVVPVPDTAGALFEVRVGADGNVIMTGFYDDRRVTACQS